MPQKTSLDVTIVGAGYVGLTTGIALAYLGHRVTCVDKNSDRIESLNRGVAPIHEDFLDEMLEISKDRLAFTEDLKESIKGSKVVIIAVGTPAKPSGEADTQFVEMVAREIAYAVVPDQSMLVIVKSTVPIGSNRRVASVMQKVIRERNIYSELFFASNPEFLREGMAIYDTFFPDRIVVGSESEESVSLIRQLYRPILEQTFSPPKGLRRPLGYSPPPLITTDTTSAEMIKYAANAFLAVKISYINEIGGLCERVGADVVEVARGIGLDSRIGARFLQAGVGWGGSCFPKDTLALQAVAGEYSYELPIVSAAREVNFRQKLSIVEKMQRVLKVLRGRTISVLGLAFKSGTDDVRDSPSIEVIQLLLQRGVHIKVFDPIAMKNAHAVLGDTDVEFCSSALDAVEGADAIFLGTEWEEFRNLNWSSIEKVMRTPIVIDGRNFLDKSAIIEHGMQYIGIGRV